MDFDQIALGKRLQYYRETGKVTQQEMANACGLSKNYISALERGINKCNVAMIVGYSKKLGISTDELIGLDSNNIIPDLQKLLSSLDKEQQTKILNMIKAML